MSRTNISRRLGDATHVVQVGKVQAKQARNGHDGRLEITLLRHEQPLGVLAAQANPGGADDGGDDESGLTQRRASVIAA